MTDAPDPILDALRRALSRAPEFPDAYTASFEALPVTGLQHRLYRLRGLARGGAGVLLRVPRDSHWRLSPRDALEYQAEAFRRLGPSLHVPKLFAVIAPREGLPFGALAVEEIIGRPPSLPAELPALADALAAIHALRIPAKRAPLIDQADPFGATLALSREQASFAEEAGLAGETRHAIADEVAWAEGFIASRGREGQPRALVLTDTQPGNFVVEESGRARAVDLEKSIYGSPAIDLAHLTLAPSTGWHPSAPRALAPADIVAFYRRYLDRVPAAFAAAMRPWLDPTRRLTWLRIVTAFAKMTALWRRGAWTGGDLDPDFRAHVLAHIAASHEPARVAEARAEWLEGPGIASQL